MEFSLTPEQYAELARYIAVVVIVGMACGWAIASAGHNELQDEEQSDERSERRRY